MPIAEVFALSMVESESGKYADMKVALTSPEEQTEFVSGMGQRILTNYAVLRDAQTKHRTEESASGTGRRL